MIMDILGSLGAFGGHLVGYIVPFLFVLTIVVFFHELGHFLVARWCGIRVLTFSIGFGPEIVGFNDRYGTRWKISAIPLGGYVKFFGDDNAASVPDHEAAAAMSEEEKTVSFVHQPVGTARRHGGGRADREFHPGDRRFLPASSRSIGKQTTSARVDTVQPASAAQAAGFKPGDLVLAIDGQKIDSFSDMQRIVSVSAGETLNIVVERGGVQVTLKATPALTGGQGQFRQQTISSACSASAAPWRPATSRRRRWVRCRRSSPASQETWFVVDRTLSYIGGVFAGREARRPARRPNSHRPGLRAGGVGRFCRADASDRRAVGFDRALEPVPDSAARWRSPFVLWDRGDSWPAAVRARPGGRVPHRLGDRGDVDDICNV